MAEQSNGKRERYVDYANHCLQLAKTVVDDQSRILLREMASGWLKLADESSG